MPEILTFQTGDTRVAEKIIDQPGRWPLLLAHVVLPPGEAIHRHPVNADAFFLVVRGTLTLAAGDGTEKTYPRGTVLHLPDGTLMSPRNAGPDVMEMFVLKTPHPEARP